MRKSVKCPDCKEDLDVNVWRAGRIFAPKKCPHCGFDLVGKEEYRPSKDEKFILPVWKEIERMKSEDKKMELKSQGRYYDKGKKD